MKRFSLYVWNYSDSLVFGNGPFGEIKDHILRTTRFQKKKCYGRFRHVATLRKKVFWRPPVKCFSLFGSNNSDSFPFENAAFGDTKDHTLRIALLQQRISMKVLRLYLPYVKGICTRTSKVLFSFRLKLLRFSSFQECCFWRGDRSQFENDTFSEKNLRWKFWVGVYFT